MKLPELIERHGDKIVVLLCCVFTAGGLWATTSNSLADNERRISKLERHDQRGSANITWMGNNIVLIMRQLHIQPLPKPEDESEDGQ